MMMVSLYITDFLLEKLGKYLKEDEFDIKPTGPL